MIPFEQPCTVWLIASLSYTGHFAETMLLVMKGKEILLHAYGNGKKLKKEKTNKQTTDNTNGWQVWGSIEHSFIAGGDAKMV